MITVTRLGEFGHRRRRRWRVRRSIQIYSDSHWGRMNSKVEIIWLRARLLDIVISQVVYSIVGHLTNQNRQLDQSKCQAV